MLRAADWLGHAVVYKDYDSYGPDRSDQNAIKLVGPTSVGECETVKKALRSAFSRLKIDVAFEVGADD